MKQMDFRATRKLGGAISATFLRSKSDVTRRLNYAFAHQHRATVTFILDFRDGVYDHLDTFIYIKLVGLRSKISTN